MSYSNCSVDSYVDVEFWLWIAVVNVDDCGGVGVLGGWAGEVSVVFWTAK